MMVNHQSFLMDDKSKQTEYRMALQKRPGKPGTTKPIKGPGKPGAIGPIKERPKPGKPGKPIKPGKPVRPGDTIKTLPRIPGTNPQLDQIKKQIEEKNKKDGQYVDSLYNTYPM